MSKSSGYVIRADEPSRVCRGCGRVWPTDHFDTDSDSPLCVHCRTGRQAIECERCGTPFVQSRRTQRFCSTTCRVAAHAAAKRAEARANEPTE